MSHHDDTPRDDADRLDDAADRMVERNVSELLRQAYAPVEPDPEFARRTTDLLLAEAVRRSAGSAPPTASTGGRVLPWVTSVAAAVLLGGLLWITSQAPPVRPVDTTHTASGVTEDGGGLRIPRVPGPTTSDLTGALVPAAAPERVELPVVSQGALLRTGPRDRSRVRLPDGSTLTLDHETRVRVAGLRRIEVEQGRVFVDVASADEFDGRRLVAVAGEREVTAKGTSFELTRNSDDLAVTVAEGVVSVEGAGDDVLPGERLSLDADGRAVRERVPDVADALAWLRETLRDSPLVAESGDDRSSIVVVDTAGQDVQLELRDYHVDVHVEDGFARTTIDQTFFNHLYWRTEGTFRFPLPAGASISRLAMYVAGARMEAGMASREHAREVYEQIRWTRRDPALLEWVDGSTFKLRVFPLEPREEKRLLLSYTEPLRSADGAFTYRFPGGHDQPAAGRWSVRIRVVDGAIDGTVVPPGYASTIDGDDLLLTAEAERVVPDVDLTVPLARQTVGPELHRHRADASKPESGEYAMVRIPLEFDAPAQRRRRDWVVLFEASGSRSPLLARAQIELVRQVLANASHDDTVRVLTANVAPRWLSKGGMVVHPSNVDLLTDWLGDTHLVGALDLEAALREANRACETLEDPVLLHVGGGVATLGETDAAKLASLVEHGDYVGLAVGKRWSREFMKQAAGATGGSFRQISAADDLAWTGFEVVAGLDAPRLIGASVEGGAAEWLLDADVIEHGDELLAYARFEAGAAIPSQVTVHGTVDGRAYSREVALETIDGTADYVPRAWARLELDRLTAEDAAANRDRIIALSREAWVMSPFTSLIVLETEQMYRDSGIEQGVPDGWAAYEAPDKIEVVREWNAWWGGGSVAATGRTTRDELLRSTLFRSGPYVLQDPYGGGWHAGAYATVWDRLQTRAHAWSFDNHGVGLPLSVQGRDGAGLFFNELGDGDFRARTENVFDRLIGNVRSSSRMTETASRELPRPASGPVGAFDLPIRLGSSSMGSGSGGPLPSGATLAGDKSSLAGRFGGGAGGVAGFFSRSHLDRLDFEFEDDEELAFADEVSVLSYLAPSGRGYDPYGYGYGHWHDPFQRLIHSPPSFTWNWHSFGDLAGHAPGMRTWWSDIQGLIEEQATDVTPPRRGEVTDAAAVLIERARQGGWVQVQVGGTDEDQGHRAWLDGAGRLRIDRVTEMGLAETVLADGEFLWHVYPELGIANRRRLNRFHWAELWSTFPVFLPPTEVLAVGHHVGVEGASTLVLTPIADGEPLYLELDADLCLRERRFGDYRERLVDGARRTTGPDLDARTPFEVVATAAPELAYDRASIITLRTPARTGWQGETDVTKLTDDKAEERLSTLLGTHQYEAAKLLVAREWSTGSKGRGGWVLLVGSGWTWNVAHAQHDFWKDGPFDPSVILPDDPVAAHLTDVMRTMQSQHDDDMVVGDDAPPFVRALSKFAEAMRMRQSGTAWQEQKRFQTLCVEAAETLGATDMSWAAAQMATQAGLPAGKVADRLITVLDGFTDRGALGRMARYEQAGVLAQSDRREEARERFVALADEVLRAGGLLAIDSRVTQMFSDDEGDWNGWVDSVRDELARDEDLLRLALFSTQLQRIGRQDTGERLRDDLERRLPELSDERLFDVERLLIRIDQAQGLYVAAERRAERLVADSRFSEDERAWWALVRVLDQSGSPSVTARERALELSMQQLGDVVDLQAIRMEYGTLLAQFQQVASSLRTARVEPTEELMTRVARATDHWRSLDPDPTTACMQAAAIFAELGRDDLAWTYATTPLDARPSEPEPWVALAQSLATSEHVALASRAYRRAHELDPIDGEILWQHAELFWQRGDRESARPVLQLLAEGDFGERFAAQVQRAKERLGR